MLNNHQPLNRRAMLQRSGAGAGLFGLASLLADDGLFKSHSGTPSGDAMAPRFSHFPVRAKSVIWIFTNGGPSQVDTWDYKPELQKRDGVELAGFDANTGFFTNAVGPLMQSPFGWQQHGQSGTWVSDIFPKLSTHVDKMAFIHSCHTDSNNHSPALFKMNTGSTRMGWPCVGSWLTYGLGSESRDLPAFMVMSDPLDRGLPKGHASNWGAGFLPSVFQGTWLRPKGTPIDNLVLPEALDAGSQRAQLDLLAKLNQNHLVNASVGSELNARIESFELAYRMQTAAPEAFDVRAEPEHVQKLYGMDQEHCSHVAAQCLMARRLVERGVRCVQIYSGGMENQRSWDGHQDIAGNHRGFALETDQPVAGLLSDLEQRGMLDETLVIWGGEFGRLPVSQKGKHPGRDHNPHAFTFWFAGGGVQGGFHHGHTDEIGFKAVDDRVSVNDLHATILHLMGMDHERLTFYMDGRDFRLTDVGGNVVHSIIA
ncbi:MAG: DUF1501 domain-containing protein [Verrucomicrobiota bacterium]|jgi:hypothetical protein|nr:DUF1501 domain-containing protein [Verrucomicrobiota bacterium]